MLVQGTNTLGDKTQSFKNELLKSSGIKSVTVGDYLPISATKRDGNTFWKEGKVNEDLGVFGQKWQVDYDYFGNNGHADQPGKIFFKGDGIRFCSCRHQ